MCGIAGIAFVGRQDPPSESVVRCMCDAISYRGPDGAGFCARNGVTLGHRRLAIIDLESGVQPMFNEDGGVATVFNGEIYDFQELRSELGSSGHVFRTRSDTEVLVHGWEEWGVALPQRLNGMFAFAIHDRHNRKLFLARDRLGVKPLYWYRGGDRFVFASEMGALLASGHVPREIDPGALELYLHYQYVPAPLTIYRDVRKLEPAQWLELDLATGALRTATYWKLDADAEPLTGRPLGEWVEQLEALLDDAVRIRLVADVPFGAFLSGGTDSGIVTAMMARRLGAPVRTFSIGLADAADELPRARAVAQRYHTDHEEFRVAAEGLTLIPSLARHFGEPFADSSAIPTHHVSRLARGRVKMVLTGDGGDETFAGYRSYSTVATAPPTGLPRARPVPVLRPPATARARASSLYRRAWSAAGSIKRAVLGQRPLPRRRGSIRWDELYDRCMSHFGPEERRQLLGGKVPISPYDHFTARYPFPAADSTVAAAQFCDLHSYLPGDILTKVDRMSMANSLEVRSPLLDYRIAELAFRMPTEVKLPEAHPDAEKGKFVLKELAARHLGREYVYAPKEGFGIPIGRWLREDSAGYLRDVLLGSESPMFGVLDRSTVRRMATEHLEGRAAHDAKLWNLLMLDAWYRHVHLDASRTEPEAQKL